MHVLINKIRIHCFLQTIAIKTVYFEFRELFKLNEILMIKQDSDFL